MFLLLCVTAVSPNARGRICLTVPAAGRANQAICQQTWVSPTILITPHIRNGVFGLDKEWSVYRRTDRLSRHESGDARRDVLPTIQEIVRVIERDTTILGGIADDS